MMLLISVALAIEPIYVDRGVGALGYDTAGVLWVQAGPEILRHVDGKVVGRIPGNRLLADGRGPVITARGSVLSVHDASPPREVVLDAAASSLARTSDGGFVVLGREVVTRHDGSGLERDRALHGCRRGTSLYVAGDDIWVGCGPWKRWTHEGVVEEPLPMDYPVQAPWRLDDGQRVVDRASGEELAVLPGWASAPFWTDARLLGIVHDRTDGSRALVWADVTSGEVRELDPRGGRLDRASTALAPDGRTLAVGGRQVVDFFDLEEGRWMTDTVLHRSRAELLGVSGDGQRAISGDYSGARILWRRDEEPVPLAPPRWPPRKDDGWGWGGIGVGAQVPHSAAFSSDGARLVSTFNGGVFTVHDGRSGAFLWQGHADPETLEGPRIAFDVVPVHRGPSCMTGEKRPLSAPMFSADGAYVVTGGAHDGRSLLLVWDAKTGEVVQRYLFDSGAYVRGSREDARIVVLAGDSLFALHAGRGDVDPELIHANVQTAWVRDGKVSWLEIGADRREFEAVPRPEPERRVVLEAGRAIFR